MNVLKSHLKQSVETMLLRGISQREIARVLGVDTKTTRRIARELAKSCGVATDPVDDVEPDSWTLATDCGPTIMMAGSNSLGVATDWVDGRAAKTPTLAIGDFLGADQKEPGWPPVHRAGAPSCLICRPIPGI